MGGVLMYKRSRLLAVAFSVVVGLITPTAGQSSPVLNWTPPSAFPTGTTVDSLNTAGLINSTKSGTIPIWVPSNPDISNLVNYKFAMVGKDPTVKQSSQTSIDTAIIPVRFTSSSLVFDPENNDPCSPNRTPALNVVQASPIFQNFALPGNLRSLGEFQFGSLFQRANFWVPYIQPKGINGNYQVNLSPILLNTEESTKHTIAIEALGGSLLPADPNSCHTVAMIDVSKWETYLQTVIFPALPHSHVGPKMLPIFLFSNVVMFAGQQCCILGYHNAVPSAQTGAANGKLQTYIVANYDSTVGNSRGQVFTGAFPNAPDIVALANAVAGWMDNPTTLNPTPKWQLTINGGCQDVLEVAFPPGLTGALTTLTAPHKPIYHVQDLAFKSWFYGDGTNQSKTGNSGFGGSYSLFSTGNFATSPATCP
jgi:hypothetical protein